ncbi:MAG: histidinol-phosphate transaminase [Anaerolineae bacterium]
MTTRFDPAQLLAARVQALEEYAPEPLQETAQRLGLPVGQLIKLDANENPYGPTRRTLLALSGHNEYQRYPDAISRRLTQALGRHLGVNPATILVGNGSDELIDVIFKLFRPGPSGGGIREAIDCPPTFGMYRLYATSHDLNVLEIPRDSRFGLDLEAIERYVRADPTPRILFLASPNNPDGRLLPEGDLLRLLDLPLLLVLDEAYVEFSGSSRVQWVAERDNLIVLRTFSKWAGLAGLRVGYGVFPEALMLAVRRCKSPYNVNVAAQVAALATLEDLAEAEAVVAKIVAERQRFSVRLRELPFLEVFDSQANYVLCRAHDLPVESIRATLERRGILLRYFGGALSDCFRISVGTPTQDEAVLVALRTLDSRGGSHG